MPEQQDLAESTSLDTAINSLSQFYQDLKQAKREIMVAMALAVSAGIKAGLGDHDLEDMDQRITRNQTDIQSIRGYLGERG